MVLVNMLFKKKLVVFYSCLCTFLPYSGFLGVLRDVPRKGWREGARSD